MVSDDIPLLVSHRASNSKGYIGNSLDAIVTAHEDNPDGAIEIDLGMTKDKIVVVTHDYFINRKRLKDQDYREVRDSVVALGDVMEKVDALFYFEIKRYTDWRGIINYLHENGLLERNRILSSKLDALKYAKDIGERIYCNYLATDLDAYGNKEYRRVFGINVPLYNMKVRPLPISRKQVLWSFRFNFDEISAHKYFIEWFFKNTKYFRGKINLGFGQINDDKDIKIVDKYKPEVIYSDKVWYIIDKVFR